mmetsp:Transcript_1931/g.3660  ORF Transcript_1931/g.3660 Transcript_1931/m.3660 type:complete len:225 (+) Transcript_1931:377-1051(+)
MCIFGFSSSLPSAPSFSSAAFLAAAAFFLAAGSLNSCCFLFQVVNNFFHSDKRVANHSPGCRSSTRSVNFLAETKSRRYSLHLSSGNHSKSIRSKPSSMEGMLNFAKDSDISLGLKSGTSFLRNDNAFSASVRDAGSMATSSSSMFAAASASSISASAFASMSSPLFFLSLASRAFFGGLGFFPPLLLKFLPCKLLCFPACISLCFQPIVRKHLFLYPGLVFRT